MRRLALVALIAAAVFQAPLPLLAEPPEDAAAPRQAEMLPPEPMPQTQYSPEAVVPVAQEPEAEVPEEAPPEQAPPEVVPSVPVSEEGAPTEVRLSIGDTTQSRSQPEVDVEPAQDEEPTGEEPVVEEPVDNGGEPVDEPTGTDEEETDEEEFEKEFKDEQEQPEEETPAGGGGGTTPAPAPASAPVSGLPSTGADLLSLLLTALALILAGLSLRRVPAARF